MSKYSKDWNTARDIDRSACSGAAAGLEGRRLRCVWLLSSMVLGREFGTASGGGLKPFGVTFSCLGVYKYSAIFEFARCAKWAASG